MIGRVHDVIFSNLPLEINGLFGRQLTLISGRGEIHMDEAVASQSMRFSRGLANL